MPLVCLAAPSQPPAHRYMDLLLVPPELSLLEVKQGLVPQLLLAGQPISRDWLRICPHRISQSSCWPVHPAGSDPSEQQATLELISWCPYLLSPAELKRVQPIITDKDITSDRSQDRPLQYPVRYQPPGKVQYINHSPPVVQVSPPHLSYSNNTVD